MDVDLAFFANDRYTILKLLYDNQVKIKEDYYVPLSQQEIADIAHFSKIKANKILNELINAGYVTFFNGKRSKYTITAEGKRVLQSLQ